MTDDYTKYTDEELERLRITIIGLSRTHRGPKLATTKRVLRRLATEQTRRADEIRLEK